MLKVGARFYGVVEYDTDEAQGQVLLTKSLGVVFVNLSRAQCLGITHSKRTVAAALFDDERSLESLGSDYGDRELLLIRIHYQDYLIKVRTMLQDSWHAEIRIPGDRLKFSMPSIPFENIFPSFVSESTVYSMSIDNSDMSSDTEQDEVPSIAEDTSLAWEDFKHRVHNLPLELFQIVRDTMFDDVFGPKDVFPHKDPSILNVFLALDRHLYRKYSDIYWRQNTWIVGNGRAEKTMQFMSLKPFDFRIDGFSEQTPNRVALGIKSIHISLSREDIPVWHQPMDPEDGIPFELRRTLDIPDYQDQTEHFKSTAFEIWQQKFDRIAVLNLQHFTLDARDAFAPNGEYLGVSAVEQFIPFADGLPSDIKILAPTKALIREICNVFNATNIR